MNRTYYLVLYDNKFPKGSSAAIKSVLSEEDKNVMLQDSLPLIEKSDGRKYKTTAKRIFQFVGISGEEVTFIVVDADKVK